MVLSDTDSDSVDDESVAVSVKLSIEEEAPIKKLCNKE